MDESNFEIFFLERAITFLSGSYGTLAIILFVNTYQIIGFHFKLFKKKLFRMHLLLFAQNFYGRVGLHKHFFTPVAWSDISLPIVHGGLGL